MLLEFWCFIIYNAKRISIVAEGKYLSKKVPHGHGARVTGEVSMSHMENIYIGDNSFINGG